MKKTQDYSLDVRAGGELSTGWEKYLAIVPTWERERIATLLRDLEFKTQEDFRKLNLLLAAEVASGALPPDFIKSIDPLLKNIFASLVIEGQASSSSMGGLRAFTERLTYERKQISPVTPVYAGPTVTVIEGEKVKVG
jgi:hypothetical protein